MVKQPGDPVNRVLPGDAFGSRVVVLFVVFFSFQEDALFKDSRECPKNPNIERKSWSIVSLLNRSGSL